MKFRRSRDGSRPFVVVFVWGGVHQILAAFISLWAAIIIIENAFMCTACAHERILNIMKVYIAMKNIIIPTN